MVSVGRGEGGWEGVEGEEREGERVCGGGKGGDGHLHMQQPVVACNN